MYTENTETEVTFVSDFGFSESGFVLSFYIEGLYLHVFIFKILVIFMNKCIKLNIILKKNNKQILIFVLFLLLCLIVP